MQEIRSKIEENKAILQKLLKNKDNQKVLDKWLKTELAYTSNAIEGKEMFAFFNKYQEKIKNSSAAECRQRLGIKRSMDIIDQKNKNDIIKKYKEDALTKK